MRALKLLNDHCHHVEPMEDVKYENTPMNQIHSTSTAAGVSTVGVRDIPNHKTPINSAVASGMHEHCKRLDDYITLSNMNSKNVEMLLEAERLCSELNGLRVTFCKSGKDRTGMAVTLEQSRVLGERFSCGNSAERVLRDANIMREYGCRILIAEKNIGRKIYSINSLQTQFIPLLYRPPVNTQENLIKGADLS
mgnify:CR=1 FL=1